ncbi:hypothetical protein M8818_003411 [Zalaria obscura]|uniref:Uncharacterized protein n=1 Tax=Zalaria obscura TaxID=2024903 RepID=A0ACC3SFF2_9PEZI
MHALLSFSASHFAWESKSTEVRELSIEHGGIALRGLHDAIGNFSRSNADGVLAGSLLLISQATDWRSWSSLKAGIRSVRAAMSSWRHESSFADYLAQDEVEAVRNSPRQPQTIQQRHVVLQTVINSLQQLRPYLAGSETELSWTAQLLDYVQRLQGSEPAKSTEEQFNHIQRSSSYGGFGYNTSEWGAMPSPGFPPTPYNAQDEDVFGYDASLRSGFVAGPPTVWT